LRIEDFAASGPTAIADLRLSEDRGEKRNDVRVLNSPRALSEDLPKADGFFAHLSAVLT
jgi:hypothetical protein